MIIKRQDQQTVSLKNNAHYQIYNANDHYSYKFRVEISILPKGKMF